MFHREFGLPINYKWTKYWLNLYADINKVDRSRIKPHSFRIGGASDMKRRGATLDQIKVVGRWKSSAVESYLRFDESDVRDNKRRFIG